MSGYVKKFLIFMRPAFSREATFIWFVVCFAGFLTRTDNYGVSSIVRALLLAPACYPSLLHFFHSTAWSAQGLFIQWRKWLQKEKDPHLVEGRMVMFGDHTKNVKDGRRMPLVTTLHQDSETGSKPSFFRGHHWGALSLLIKAKNKFMSLPLEAEIHPEQNNESRATRLVNRAGKIAQEMESKAYLVLDAFFAVGPVFQTAARYGDRLHILSRAKKNVVAYQEPKKPKKQKRGRPREYGKKLKLIELFEKWENKFETEEMMVYQKMETVRFLTLDLIWKPVKRKLRFFLVQSSRGKIIMMTCDLNMEIKTALTLYCQRVTIETLFNMLKNLLGGMQYHFWSKYLAKASRKPAKNQTNKQASSQPEKTKNTINAIEKFVALQLIALGSLQLLASRFELEIKSKARCFLRTPCNEVPSIFMTKIALANIIQANLANFAKDLITQIIMDKQRKAEYNEEYKNAA